MRSLLAPLLLLALLAVPAGASAAPPRDFFGVMVDGPFLRADVPLDRAAEARLMRRAGVGSARLALYWHLVEPQPGRMRWGRYDRFFRTLARQGVRVFPVLYLAPPWARTGDRGSAASPPRIGAFARFAAAAVRRYGTRGTFWRKHRGLPSRPVRHWQVWNEPNLQRYWSVRPWAPSYTRLLRAAHRRIKAVDRRAQVVTGGLTGDLDELTKQLYRAGAKGSFDAVGLHPYRPRVADVVRSLAETRTVIRRHRDRARIVASEVSFTSGVGWSTVNYGIERTERGQRTALVDVMRRLVARRRQLGLDAVYWYTWMSWDRGLEYSWEYAGLRRLTSGGPLSKPALAGYRAVAR